MVFPMYLKHSLQHFFTLNEAGFHCRSVRQHLICRDDDGQQIARLAHICLGHYFHSEEPNDRKGKMSEPSVMQISWGVRSCFYAKAPINPQLSHTGTVSPRKFWEQIQAFLVLEKKCHIAFSLQSLETFSQVFGKNKEIDDIKVFGYEEYGAEWLILTFVHIWYINTSTRMSANEQQRTCAWWHIRLGTRSLPWKVSDQCQIQDPLRRKPAAIRPGRDCRI